MTVSRPVTDDRRTLETGAAFVDLGALSVLRVTGRDRVSFLHRLLTGKVDGVPAGQGARSLLLTIKGQIVEDLRVLILPDEIRLVVPPGQAQPATTVLTRYAVMDDVVIAPVPEWQARGLYGPRAAEVLRGMGVPVPDDLPGRPLAHATVASPFGELWLVSVQGFGTQGLWIWGTAAALAELDARAAAAGLPWLRDEVAEALRIWAGEPKFGVEITSEYFPMEVGLTDAIDYGKGCYLGQEPIVRVRDRGHVNWRLVRLRLRAPAPVAAGDKLESDLKPKAGTLTSVATFPGEPPVALALLHVSVPAGTEVRVRHGEDPPAAAEVLAIEGA